MFKSIERLLHRLNNPVLSWLVLAVSFLFFLILAVGSLCIILHWTWSIGPWLFFIVYYFVWIALSFLVVYDACYFYSMGIDTDLYLWLLLMFIFPFSLPVYALFRDIEWPRRVEKEFERHKQLEEWRKIGSERGVEDDHIRNP